MARGHNGSESHRLEKCAPELSALAMRITNDAMARVEQLEKGTCLSIRRHRKWRCAQRTAGQLNQVRQSMFEAETPEEMEEIGKLRGRGNVAAYESGGLEGSNQSCGNGRGVPEPVGSGLRPDNEQGNLCRPQ